MQFSKWLKSNVKKLPRWTFPYLRASAHVVNELLASLKALRCPRLANRIEFSDLEIVEMQNVFLRGPGAHQVLVKVLVSAMSPGTETAVLMGLPNAVRPMPFAPGYSGYGVVISAGKGSRIKKGQLVAGQLGHASLAVVDEINLVVCDPSDDAQQMAMIELACIVQQGVRKARIKIGEHVVVIGAGLLGQLSVIYADLVGAGKITVLTRSDRKRASIAAALPPHQYRVITSGSDNTEPLNADVALECVGTGEALTTASSNVRRNGRVVNLGSTRDIVSASSLFSVVAENSVQMVGSHISTLPSRDGTPNNMTKRQERSVFVDLVRRGKFVLPSHSVVPATSSENVNNAYESITAGSQDATVLFEWN